MRWLRLHALAFAAAIRRLAAQPFASTMSIAVLAMAIALPVLAVVVLRSAGAAAADVDTDPHMNVYLAIAATDDDVARIRGVLAAHPDAARVRFIPRDEAFEELRTRTHLADILATFDRNPLPHAFTVRIRPEARARAAALRTAWLALPGVDEVQADFAWSERLARWVRLGQRLLMAGSLILAVVVAFIVGHLIRLQVLTRREEIEVSQLIGATAADVRRPFLYHGALQGFLAGAAAAGIGAALTAWARSEMSALTSAYVSELKIVFLAPSDVAWVAGAAAMLGLAGSWVAVGRELRRFSRPG